MTTTNQPEAEIGLFAVFYDGETRPVAGFVLEQDAERYARQYAGDATWEIRRVDVTERADTRTQPPAVMVDAERPLHSVCTYKLKVGERIWFYKGAVICELLDDARVIIKESSNAATGAQTCVKPIRCVFCAHYGNVVNGICQELGTYPVQGGESRAEHCGCQCEFLAITTAAEPWKDVGGHEWEIKQNVTCVECPHCLFTFAAFHTVKPEDYDCPNCDGCPDAAQPAATPSISAAIAAVEGMLNKDGEAFNYRESHESVEHWRIRVNTATKILERLRALQPSTPSEKDDQGTRSNSA